MTTLQNEVLNHRCRQYSIPLSGFMTSLKLSSALRLGSTTNKFTNYLYDINHNIMVYKSKKKNIFFSSPNVWSQNINIKFNINIISQHFWLLNKYLIILIVAYHYTRFNDRKNQAAYGICKGHNEEYLHVIRQYY